MYYPKLKGIKLAAKNLKNVAFCTPLIKNLNESKEFGASIYLKREDLQAVRSYKIRGAFNKISSLSDDELQGGVVCASAGNHAQGVAFSCNNKKCKGVIFMPTPTPQQATQKLADKPVTETKTEDADDLPF